LTKDVNYKHRPVLQQQVDRSAHAADASMRLDNSPPTSAFNTDK